MRIFKTKWVARFVRRENIEPDELEDLRAIAADFLAASHAGLARMLEADELQEIEP